MSRSKRLQIVLEMAEREEKKAAEIFELARKQKEQDEAKLRDLIQYSEEYEVAFRQPLPTIRAEEMQRQRGFLIQLSEAREQQERILQQREQVFVRTQKRWQTAHLKRKTLLDFISRMRSSEEQALSKKEEKMLDEWFTQTAAQRADRAI